MGNPNQSGFTIAMPHCGSRSMAFLNEKAAYGVFASGHTYRESALVKFAMIDCDCEFSPLLGSRKH